MTAHYDPYVLARCLDDEAKLFWTASIGLGLGGFVLSVIGVIYPNTSTIMAYLASIAAGLSFGLSLKFDSSRSRSQELRRKLDIQDAFGWSIEKETFSDIVLRCSGRVKNKARDIETVEPYFESKEPYGPKRALQNVRESAWWSEHLSEKMFYILLTITICVFAIAIVSMIVALASVDKTDAKNLSVFPKIARVVTSFIMIAISLNLVKLTLNYYGFSRKAAKCKDAADQQLKKSAKNQDAAIMKMYDYFIARSSSPVIPTWLWQWSRSELNQMYPYKSEDAIVQENYAKD